MRSKAVITSLLAVVVSMMVPVVASGRVPVRDRDCDELPGKVVASSGQAVVFGQPARSIRSFFVCDRRSGRVRALNGSDLVSLAQVTLNGQFVAFSKGIDSRRDGFKVYVQVYDVRQRRIRTSVEAYRGSVGNAPAGPGVTQLELRPDGDVAWIAQSAPFVVEVRAAKLGDDNARILDDDPSIVPGSLAVSDSFVYWQRPTGSLAAPW